MGREAWDGRRRRSGTREMGWVEEEEEEEEEWDERHGMGGRGGMGREAWDGWRRRSGTRGMGGVEEEEGREEQECGGKRCKKTNYMKKGRVLRGRIGIAQQNGKGGEWKV